MIVFDDNLMFLGSFNIDLRFVYINIESVVLFDNLFFVKRVCLLFKDYV